MNNRLRELRAVRRWSQADLADRLDVSRQTINAVETGRYDPSLREVGTALEHEQEESAAALMDGRIAWRVLLEGQTLPALPRLCP